MSSKISKQRVLVSGFEVLEFVQLYGIVQEEGFFFFFTPLNDVGLVRALELGQSKNKCERQRRKV